MNGIDMDYMSEYIMSILFKALENQRLLKLIYYPVAAPFEQPDILNPDELIGNFLIPVPFNSEVLEVEKSELRVFDSVSNIEKRIMMNSQICFQIIVHNELWLIRENINGELVYKIRPYEIRSELVKTFYEENVDKISRFNFSSKYKGGLFADTSRWVYVNDKVGYYEVFANTRMFSK